MRQRPARGMPCGYPKQEHRWFKNGFRACTRFRIVQGGVVGVTAAFVGANDSYRWAFIFAGVMIVLAAIALQTVKPERVVSE